MPDQAPDIHFDFGVTRLFGDCDIASTGLVSGWAVPEEAHTWNDGPQAILKMRTSEPERPCRITFDGEPFLSEECPHQDIILLVNGFQVGFWQLAESRTYRLTAEIEPEQLFLRDGGAIAKCVWCLPNSVRPVDVGQGSDTRQLGFCFRSIAIAESD